MFKSFNTTGIGSLPHTDPAEACKIILDHVDIPFWPQLPQRSFLESMVPQYSEGFPFVRVGEDKVEIQVPDEAKLAEFYEAIAENRGFPISGEYAAGLNAFLDILSKGTRSYHALKGHITGPLTFTLSLTDSSKRPIFFDEEMRELSVELLKGKAGWQIDQLRQYAEKILIFIDEPILTALGTSTYIGVSNEEAARVLRDTAQHIRDCGALSAIHCCGKADWPLVLSSGIDVFNFDAYEFGTSLSLYPDEIRSYLDRGGYIAWGIVPTTEKINDVTTETLSERFEQALTSLEKAGVSQDQLRAQSLLTPSCGTGSLNATNALKAFSLLKDLRDRYVEA